MRVIFFTKYTRMGASSRLRTFQFIPHFEAAGIECEISSFFTDDYLTELYKSRKHNKKLAFRSFIERCTTLLSVKRYDLVIIEKELFPYFPATAERLLKLLNIRYIVDYDDAVWHNYDVANSRLVRTFLSRKIDRVMAGAAAITAGNAYIRNKALQNNAHCLVLPTVIDTERYRMKVYHESDVFTIGWIGSPITYKYLAYLKPVFEKLAERYKIRLKLIGARTGIGLEGIELVLPWSEESEVSDIQSFNVGIMPLEDNIWERGKCGYKLIQYMGCGVPVLGTPLGANDTIIRHGRNGFKATTLEEWLTCFSVLIEGGISKERALGTAARNDVETGYSLKVAAAKYIGLIKSLTEGS